MVPYENRMTMHKSMLNLVGESRNLREHFKKEVERANSQMELLQNKTKEWESELEKWEEERCEAIHSSINQFVVFEKFVEMNNKYDVKNFADTLENFKVEDELKAIALTSRTNQVGDLYKFNAYVNKRYDLS